MKYNKSVDNILRGAHEDEIEVFLSQVFEWLGALAVIVLVAMFVWGAAK